MRSNRAMCRAARLSVTTCAVLAMHFTAVRTSALDPAKSLSQYRHASWGTSEGLPQSSVQAIAQTTDGYLWLGTQEGLVRFDGVRMTVFDKRSVPAMRSNFVWALLVDSTGALWVGTQSGLVKLHEGAFTSIRGPRDSLVESVVKALCQDRHGGIWIGTDGDGLIRLAGDSSIALTTRDGLLDDTINALLAADDGSVYIATRLGLNAFRDGHLSTLASGGMSVSALAQGRGGRVWVATAVGELARYDAEGLTMEPRPTEKEIWCLKEDRDGSLWIGTGGGGLMRAADSGGYTIWSARDGLSDDFVHALFEDREGNIWIGTSAGGFDRLAEAKFTVYSTPEAISNKTVTSICETGRGDVWLGTDGGGLSRIRGDRIATFDTRNGLANDAVMSIFPSRDGGLWAGMNDGWLARVSPDGKVSVIGGDRFRHYSVFALCETRAGALWIGTYGNGLVFYSRDRFSTYTVADGLSSDNVISLCEGADGSLWIGTSGGGLNRLKDGRFTAYTTLAGLSSDTVTALYEDAERDLWIGTHGGGLNRLRNGKIRRWSVADGLYDEVVFQILEDDSSNLWMSSNRGIFKVSKKDLEEHPQGMGRRLECVVFGTADGLRSVECSGGTQPAGWRDRHGRLWFPTMDGAAMIDPHERLTNRMPPPIVIEEAEVDHQSVSSSRLSGPAQFPPGRGQLEFQFTALSLQAPENVRFKYMLEGYDEKWVDAGTRRVAYYTNIPHGRYLFRVKACNNDGVWNENGASFEFSLQPHAYQTTWFLALCILTAATAVAGAYRLRVRRLVERQRELRALVDLRTNELRASNEQLKTSNEELQQLNEHLQKTYEEIRRAEEEMARLSDSAVGGLEEMAERVGSIAKDLASLIGAEDISVWAVEDERFVRLGGESTDEPDWDSLHSSSEARDFLAAGGRVIVPAVGMTGEAEGALVIHGDVTWAEQSQRIIRGFARYLGTALEFRKLRRQLFEAGNHTPVSRREMHDRGISTLRLCQSCKRCYPHTTDRCPVDGAVIGDYGSLPFRIQDRYQLLRLLGEGGMGAVFRARDEKLMRDVAIKIVKAKHLDDPVARFRLEREARTIARIRHPGVIAIHDSGDLHDGSTFLVTEFLHGQDLGRVIQLHGAATPTQAARVLRQAGAGLAAAHRFGVIHRDVKPANLFLIPEERGFRITVLDFGLAKSERSDIDITKSGFVVGTPAYMSPEQVRGLRLDQRSDLYSLAAVGYEVVTGRRIVNAKDVPSALAQVLNDSPAPPSTLRPGIPSSVDAAFAAALTKEPGGRPGSVTSWLESFIGELEGAPARTPEMPGWPVESLTWNEPVQSSVGDIGQERTRSLKRDQP